MDPKILEKYEKAGGIDELNKYDGKADIWSLGAICYEMITGENLFKAKDMEELKNEEKKGIYYLDLKLDLSTEIISFLNAMLQYEPDNRASTEELLKHPFLNKNVKEFTPLNFDGITYKIENGIFKINFIKNETMIKKFNKDIAEKIKMRKQNSKEEENIIEINESLLSNKIKKQNEFLKKYMNNLLADYNKARLYFKDNNLDTQEKDAAQKIVFIEKMKENFALQKPVDIKDLPKKINPEYIYGCSYKERNEKFIQIINEYKKKKDKCKNEDDNKLKNLEYIILLLEKSYTNKWTPPPKSSYKKNLIQRSNSKIYQIKFIIERKDNINIDYNFNLSLIVNSNITLKKDIKLNTNNNSNIEWIWDFNGNDWKNIDNNDENFDLFFDFKQAFFEKYKKLKINITQVKLGKPISYNISQPISNNEKIMVKLFMIPIITTGNKTIEEKELIYEKLYHSFETFKIVFRSAGF